MSIENVLCPTQQAKAVIDLVMESPDRFTKDKTALYALYSVMDNLNRALKAIDELFDENNVLCEALCRLGVFEEVMRELDGKRQRIEQTD